MSKTYISEQVTAGDVMLSRLKIGAGSTVTAGLDGEIRSVTLNLPAIGDLAWYAAEQILAAVAAYADSRTRASWDHNDPYGDSRHGFPGLTKDCKSGLLMAQVQYRGKLRNLGKWRTPLGGGRRILDFYMTEYGFAPTKKLFRYNVLAAVGGKPAYRYYPERWDEDGERVPPAAGTDAAGQSAEGGEGA